MRSFSVRNPQGIVLSLYTITGVGHIINVASQNTDHTIHTNWIYYALLQSHNIKVKKKLKQTHFTTIYLILLFVFLPLKPRFTNKAM